LRDVNGTTELEKNTLMKLEILKSEL